MTRVSLLLALTLLISTATAHAECAWVLWERVSVSKRVDPNTAGKLPKDRNWILHAAVPTYAACNDAAKRQAERKPTERASAANIKVSELIGGGFSASADVKNPDGVMYVEVRCFPDTIDPRGPKVK